MPDNTPDNDQTQDDLEDGPQRSAPLYGSKPQLTAVAKAQQAFELRILGATWETIAQQVGYQNRSNAARAVKDVLGTLPEFDRNAMRAEWRERLRWLWGRAVQDVAAKKPGAVTAAVRVQLAAARLDGLDAPTEVVVHHPSEDELRNWVHSVLSFQGSQVEEADVLDGYAALPASLGEATYTDAYTEEHS